MVDVNIERPEMVMWLQRALTGRVSGSLVEMNFPTSVFLFPRKTFMVEWFSG